MEVVPSSFFFAFPTRLLSEKMIFPLSVPFWKSYSRKLVGVFSPLGKVCIFTIRLPRSFFFDSLTGFYRIGIMSGGEKFFWVARRRSLFLRFLGRFFPISEFFFFP